MEPLLLQTQEPCLINFKNYSNQQDVNKLISTVFQKQFVIFRIVRACFGVSSEYPSK